MDTGVHYLALNKIRKRLDDNAAEYAKASLQLREALAMGDLRENAEYDAAKDAIGKIVQERDQLSPVLGMPVVRANDSASIIEEGCVLDMKVYRAVKEPCSPGSEAWNAATSNARPAFEGLVLFGGTLPIQDLLVDSALSTETPVGKFLLGKRSGSYCIKVPGGFVPVAVKKLKSDEFTPEQIRCAYNGQV